MPDDNLLKFKGKSKTNSVNLQFTHTVDGPIIETTLPENQFLKKFITFALQDVQFQLKVSAESGISKKKLDENTFASGFIIEYLKILLEEVEKAITETKNKP